MPDGSAWFRNSGPDRAVAAPPHQSLFQESCSRLAPDAACNVDRAMNRTLRHLLVAAALVFAQQAAQLHALSHLKQDLVRAERNGKCVPPINHPAEQCIAFHAVGSALPAVALAIEPVPV